MYIALLKLLGQTMITHAACVLTDLGCGAELQHLSEDLQKSINHTLEHSDLKRHRHPLSTLDVYWSTFQAGRVACTRPDTSQRLNTGLNCVDPNASHW